MPQNTSRNANGTGILSGRKSSLFTSHRHSSKPSSASSSSVNVASPPGVNTPPYAPSRNNSPPRRAVSSRHRHSSSVTSGDLAGPSAGVRRSVSLRSVTAPVRNHKVRSPSIATLNAFFHEDGPQPNPHPSKSFLSFSAITKRQKSSEHIKDYSLFSSTEHSRPSTSMTMATTASFRNQQPGRPPGNAPSYSNGGGIGNPTAPVVPSGSVTPQVAYQTILDTASKRISTLDYLRKAHEGRVYWFNTLLFTKQDLLKLPYFTPPKLARRATNYLLLGFSLPTILDLNSQTATDYLKALNALLAEFEQYQSMHPPDGPSSGGSLGRGRIPQMFKRATGVGSSSSKGRRTSSAADSLAALGAGLGAAPDPLALTSSGASILSGTTAMSSSTASTMVANERPEMLLPTENYQHLLTPSLPFDPDFFETFATLCDVLIDCYTKVTQLIGGPEHCVPGVGELFQKADARVRKIVVQGVVREFEGTCRDGVKGEIRGVGRVVLGGLM